MKERFLLSIAAVAALSACGAQAPRERPFVLSNPCAPGTDSLGRSLGILDVAEDAVEHHVSRENLARAIDECPDDVLDEAISIEAGPMDDIVQQRIILEELRAIASGRERRTEA